MTVLILQHSDRASHLHEANASRYQLAGLFDGSPVDEALGSERSEINVVGQYRPNGRNYASNDLCASPPRVAERPPPSRKCPKSVDSLCVILSTQQVVKSQKARSQDAQIRDKFTPPLVLIWILPVHD